MTSQRTDPIAPVTIVLIHGFWVTPRSWEHWISHYEGRGYRVLAPAYPGLEVGVEALNSDPSPIEALTVPAILEHLESVIRDVQQPPILIGHSAGGAFTQILLDRGFGAAGVAISSAPTEGVAVAPLSQVKASFPVLKNPANRHKAVALTPAQWHYAFANTFTEEESLALCYALPSATRTGSLPVPGRAAHNTAAPSAAASTRVSTLNVGIRGSWLATLTNRGCCLGPMSPWVARKVPNSSGVSDAPWRSTMQAMIWSPPPVRRPAEPARAAAPQAAR